jgi:hypothetical protein
MTSLRVTETYPEKRGMKGAFPMPSVRGKQKRRPRKRTLAQTGGPNTRGVYYAPSPTHPLIQGPRPIGLHEAFGLEPRGRILNEAVPRLGESPTELLPTLEAERPSSCDAAEHSCRRGRA